MLNLNLSNAGSWQLIYYQLHVGDKDRRKIRAPMIDVIEIPVSIPGRILAVGASHVAAPPSWYTAGFFYQQVGGISLDDRLLFPGLIGSPIASVDSAKRRIILNTIELHIFERLATEHYYRFEAMAWIPKLTLAVWEYIGAETDSTNDLLETLKIDLVRIEAKVNTL